MTGHDAPSYDRGDVLGHRGIEPRPTAPMDPFTNAIRRRQAEAIALIDEVGDRAPDWELAVPCQSARRCSNHVGHVLGFGSRILFVAFIRQRPDDAGAPWARDVRARDPEAVPWPERLPGSVNGVAALAAAGSDVRGSHAAPLVTAIYDLVNPWSGPMPGLWARCNQNRCDAFELERRALLPPNPRVVASRTWRHPTAHT